LVRATDELARSRPIGVPALEFPARAIEDCHQVSNRNDEGGRQQHAKQRSQQNVIHAGILTRDIKATGDSNHIFAKYVRFLGKSDKYREGPAAALLQDAR
jgi:hypothetical protein